MSLYAKLATTYQTDPKVLSAGPLAELLWIRGLCWSKEHLTDGVVPRSALPLVGLGLDDPERHADRLVAVGLWTVHKDGWRVPFDKWAAWQTTKEQVEDLRRKRSAAGTKGNAARWNGKSDSICDSGGDAGAIDVSSPEHRAQSSERRAQNTTTTRRNGSRQPKADPAGFAEWWEQYPRKLSRTDATKAWGKALTAGCTGPQALASLEAWKWVWTVEGRDAGKVPYPATWLNRGDWREVPEVPDMAKDDPIGRVLGTNRPPTVVRHLAAIETTGAIG